jgi:O-antigen ligase
VTAAGADPVEPADPATTPSGSVEFRYQGQELALQVATGDYWGYLFVTVDGRPANLLPVVGALRDSTGAAAGYKPFSAPERVTPPQMAAPQWVRVHRAAGDGPHTVYLEVWRSWGQTPLRGVAVDALPTAPAPRWPSLLLGVAGLWLLATPWSRRGIIPLSWRRRLPLIPPPSGAVRYSLFGVGLPLAVAGLATGQWLPFAGGLTLLALAALFQPVLWLALLLLALPFDYGVKATLLPERQFSLLDLGVAGGWAIMIVHTLLVARRIGAESLPTARSSALSGPIAHPAFAEGSAAMRWSLLQLPLLIVIWAGVTAFDARYPALALREWRTLFLNPLLVGGLLIVNLRDPAARSANLRWLVGGWLAGALLAAGFGLAGYLVGGAWVVEAEGVRRIRGLYGSPNNLALYLDRSLAMTLALALLLRGNRWRTVLAIAAMVQGAALLLTFSKGSLLLALPAMALVIGWLGWRYLRQSGRSPRILIGLAAAALVAGVAIAPFLGAERFQRLFDFSGGTGFLRLQLWQSAWQMAIDHPLTGVGPDQFLYHYRSDYLLPGAWQEPNLNHPHNLVLDWWTRLGLPGLLLGMWWLGGGALRLWRRSWRGAGSALTIGLAAAAMAALAHGLIDVSYALPDLMVIWFVLLVVDEV